MLLRSKFFQLLHRFKQLCTSAKYLGKKSVYLSVYQYVYISIYLSTYLYFHLCMFWSFCTMFIYLDISFLSFSILTLAKLGHTYCHSPMYWSHSHSFCSQFFLWPNWDSYTAILLLLLFLFFSYILTCCRSPIGLIPIPFVLNTAVAQLEHTYCHSPIALNLIPFVLNTGAWGPTET